LLAYQIEKYVYANSSLCMYDSNQLKPAGVISPWSSQPCSIVSSNLPNIKLDLTSHPASIQLTKQKKNGSPIQTIKQSYWTVLSRKTLMG
jgi:hypothetical protein